MSDDPGQHRPDRLTVHFHAPKPSGTVLGRWSPTTWSRTFGAIVAAAFVFFGTMLVTGGANAGDRASGAVMLCVAPVALWLIWLRPFLLLTDEQLVVQNALAAFVIPLERVDDVRPGGWGLVVRVTGRGRPVIAMAVVKANISFFLRRKARADLVVDAINLAATRPGDPPRT